MKVLSNNPGLVDFAIGLVNSVQASTVNWEIYSNLQRHCMTNRKHLIDSSGPKDVFQANLGRILTG